MQFAASTCLYRFSSQVQTPTRHVKPRIMGRLRTLNKEFLSQFIEMYKGLPCLWQVKNKQYSDRNLKNKSYQILIKKYREVDKSADRTTIVRKINSLRNCYRRELKKVRLSGNMYKPKLWHFKKLEFLQESAAEVDENIQSETQCCLDIPMSSPPPSPECLISEGTGSEINFAHITPSSSVTTISHSTYKPKPETDRIDRIDNVLDLIGKRLRTSTSRNQDHLYYAAKNWISTLKTVSKEQQIYAVRLIGDVMCEAQLGNLSRNTRLELCENKQFNHSKQFPASHNLSATNDVKNLLEAF